MILELLFRPNRWQIGILVGLSSGMLEVNCL